MVDIQRNLSQELIFTLIAGEDGEHVILTSGDENALSASQSSDLASMCLEDQTKILLLIPYVNATVCSSRVADTILIEDGAREFGLLEL